MVRRILVLISAVGLGVLSSCSDRTLRRDARTALAQGDGERASRFFAQALDRDPGDPRLRRGLGEAWLLVARQRAEDGEDKPSDWSRSVHELERGVTDSAAKRILGEARLGWAKSLARSGDTDRAVQGLEKELVSDPRATGARNFLAILVDRRGEREHAEELFLQNTAIDSTDASAWFNLALVEWGRGRRLDAAEHMLHASKLDPKDPEILLWLERISKRFGEDGK
jgi:Flp pilus assembly protein TadD